MALLHEVIARTGAATLHISHDLALLSTVADQLLVRYAGEIVESGTTRDVLRDPCHPYTRALLAALPSVHEQRAVRGLIGRPPTGMVTDTCAFAPRCPSATTECLAGHPILQPFAAGRQVRCVRHDRIDRIDTAASRSASPAATRWPSSANPEAASQPCSM